MTTKISLLDGKYVVAHNNGVGLKAIRYGEEWRDLSGDGFILALVQRIEELEEQAKKTEGARKLIGVCEKFIEDNGISEPETIYQTDRVIENAYSFIEKICDIVGYEEVDYD